MSLLKRTPILPDESLQSYLVRVSKLNYYEALYTVETLADTEAGQTQGIQWFEALARLTGQPVSALIRASMYPSLNLKMPKESKIKDPNVYWQNKLQNSTYPKETALQFCPACLKENPYHRFYWFSPYMTVCLNHKHLLWDCCPICEQKIGIKDLLETTCSDCQFDLRHIPPWDVSTDNYWRLHLIIQWRWGMTPLITLPNDLKISFNKPNETAWLIENILKYYDDVIDFLNFFPRPQQSQIDGCVIRKVPGNNRYYKVTSAILIMLLGQEGIHEYLNAFRHRNGRVPTGNIFEDMLSLLEDCDRKKQIGVIHEQIDSFIAENYPLSTELTLLTRFNDRPDLRRKYPVINSADLARVWGMQEYDVRKNIKAGFLSEQLEASNSWKSIKESVYKAFVYSYSSKSSLARAYDYLRS